MPQQPDAPASPSTQSGVASDRRNAMGADMVRMQALSASGAVAGDGGYVYRPQDDGTITILHDPSGAATGVNLSSGASYDRIASELQAKGAMPKPEADLGESLDPAMPPPALSQERTLLGRQSPQEPPNAVSDAEAEKMRSDAIALEQEKVESPTGGTSEHPGVTERRELAEKLRAGELDMTPAPGGDFNPWSDARERIAEAMTRPDEVVEPLPVPGTPNVTVEPPSPPPEPPDTADTADTGRVNVAAQALSLPEGDPRREAALEAALREIVGD